MSRKKISEFRAKTILANALGRPYAGLEVDAHDNIWSEKVATLTEAVTYVVKVDQAVKGRFKKGLVLLDRSKADLESDVQQLFDKGYEYVLIEPYRTHEQSTERYLAIERVRDGLKLSFSELGGVDVEAHAHAIKTVTWNMVESLPETPFPISDMQAITQTFQDNFFSFLEINPLLIEADQIAILDAAVEVDSEADFFVKNSWKADDIRVAPGVHAPQIAAVRELDAESQASFALELINPNGAIFLLLSGGGASVVVADEVSNLGFGQQLANYGEYSGNPNTEETMHYTAQVLELLLASTAPRKLLIIGGGVANFTDIRQTFKGVVAAIDKCREQLQQQAVAIYVRRGGPREKEGLAELETYLSGIGVKHQVHGPELILTDIVKLGLKELEQ